MALHIEPTPQDFYMLIWRMAHRVHMQSMNVLCDCNNSSFAKHVDVTHKYALENLDQLHNISST